MLDYSKFKFPQFLPRKFTEVFLSGLRQQLSVSPSDSVLVEHVQKRIAQSLTRNTWRKYESAWNLFAAFLNERNLPFNCPIPISQLRQFAVWADYQRHLAPSTIKSYIYALSKLQLVTKY
jgi:hypothetical protein